MAIKRFNSIWSLSGAISFCLLLCVLLPGLLGHIAKHYIERAVELNNLNSSLRLEITDYQQHWFSTHFTIAAYMEDEFEEELNLIGNFPAVLKHGPITLVNNAPGLGAFYLYSQSFEKAADERLPYIGYARAGFFGNVELNINVEVAKLFNELAHTPKAKNQSWNTSPLIMSLESDYEFENIEYRIYWPGLYNASETNQSSSLAQIRDVKLQGELSRLDDERWQGSTKAEITQLSLPSNNLLLDNFEFSISNEVNISESGNRTHIRAQGEASQITSDWNHWQIPSIDFEIQNADLQALSEFYDLAERAYLEFDSPFDEFAQLEYLSTLQTMVPSLLSDDALLEITALEFTDTQSQTSKKLTGHIQFPDLPDYMDDHLISLISNTNGELEIKTLNSDQSKQISIKKGRISIDNQPFDFSVFN